MPEHIKLKIGAVVKYLPVCLFALYSISIFLFSLASVYGAGDYSVGNVYDLLGEETVFSGTVSAVVAFAVIGLIAALVGVALLETPFFDLARAAKGNGVKIARFVFKFVPCLFYFIFFILACVMFGKVSDLNHSGLGIFVFSAGPCPVLLLIFTLLFALIQAASLIAEFKLLSRVTLIPADEETGN